jgi:hypothetical protein
VKNEITDALDSLKPSDDGKTIKGTRALISALQEATGFPQSKIAEISQCSIAGIQRWVSLDSGQKTRLNHLIQYSRSVAQKLEAGETSPGQGGSFAEAMRRFPLADLESELRASLQRLTGVTVESCEISKLESSGGAVTLEFRIK